MFNSRFTQVTFATALIAGGTIAMASPANAITFDFSGNVTDVQTNIYFPQTTQGAGFLSHVQVGTPFSGYITPELGVEITVGEYTFISLPYPSTPSGVGIIEYVFGGPLNLAGVKGFRSVGIEEKDNKLIPEYTVGEFGSARDSYSGVWADFSTQKLDITSSDWGYGADFKINGNITSLTLVSVPESSSVLGTLAFGAVGTTLLLKRKNAGSKQFS